MSATRMDLSEDFVPISQIVHKSRKKAEPRKLLEVYEVQRLFIGVDRATCHGDSTPETINMAIHRLGLSFLRR